MELLTLVGMIPFVLVFLVLANAALVFTKENSFKVIQRFGKHLRFSRPGLSLKIPLIDQVYKTVTRRIIEDEVTINTITMDKVSVSVTVAVQYCVTDGKEYEAVYKAYKPEEQIRSFIFDSVLSIVSKMDLDDVFSNKDMIGSQLMQELGEQVGGLGFTIRKSLVNGVKPNKDVVASMNAINASERNKIAAEKDGEAQKILAIKRAEADAESKRLSGLGIGDQRREIAKSLCETVESLTEATGSTGADVMSLLLMTQYFDTMKDVASGTGTKVVFLPSGAGGMKEAQDQIRSAMIQATES